MAAVNYFDPAELSLGAATPRAAAGLAPYEPPPLPERRYFSEGLDAGIEGVKSAGYGVLAAGARGLGFQNAETAALAKAQEHAQNAGANAMRVQDVGGVGDVWNFAKYAFGQGLPSLATMAVGGLGGGVLGRVIAKNAITQATAQFGAKAGQRLAGSSWATGAGIGGTAASAGMETGSIFPEAVETGVENPLARSLGGGAVAGALDVLGPAMIARRFGLFGADLARSGIVGRGGIGGALKTGALDVAKMAATEAPTEAAQTYIERLAAGKPTDDPEAYSEYINAAASALPLSILGGPGGAMRGYQGRPTDVSGEAPPVEAEAPGAVQPPLVSPSPDATAAQPPLAATPEQPVPVAPTSVPVAPVEGVPPTSVPIPPVAPSPDALASAGTIAPTGTPFASRDAALSEQALVNARIGVLQADTTLDGRKTELAKQMAALQTEAKRPKDKRRSLQEIAQEKKAVLEQGKALAAEIKSRPAEIKALQSRIGDVNAAMALLGDGTFEGAAPLQNAMAERDALAARATEIRATLDNVAKIKPEFRPQKPAEIQALRSEEKAASKRLDGLNKQLALVAVPAGGPSVDTAAGDPLRVPRDIAAPPAETGAPLPPPGPLAMPPVNRGDAVLARRAQREAEIEAAYSQLDAKQQKQKARELRGLINQARSTRAQGAIDTAEADSAAAAPPDAPPLEGAMAQAMRAAGLTPPQDVAPPPPPPPADQAARERMYAVWRALKRGEHEGLTDDDLDQAVERGPMSVKKLALRELGIREDLERMGLGETPTAAPDAPDVAPPEAAAPTAPAAGTGRPKPISLKPRDDPLIKWIIRRGGIDPRYAEDLTGEKAFKANQIAPGLFRRPKYGRNGLQLEGFGPDEIALAAGVDGEAFIGAIDPNDSDGVRALTEMLRRAIAGVQRNVRFDDQEAEFEALKLSNDWDAADHAAAALGVDISAANSLEDALRMIDEAAQAKALDEDKLPLSAASNEDLVARAAQIDEDAVERAAIQFEADNASFMDAIRGIIDDADTQAIDEGGEAAQPAQTPGDRGPGETGVSEPETPYTLSGQTPAEIAADEKAAAAAARADKAKKAAETAQERTAREQAEIRARSEAAAGTFELGQSPDENLSGQGSLFQETAPYNVSVQTGTPEFKRWFGDWEATRRATPKRAAKNLQEARLAAASFLDRDLPNESTGLVATVSKTTLNKMTSASATEQSTSSPDHALAVANVDQLFVAALPDETHPDKRGEPTIKAMHRYVAPMITPSGEVRAVKMTIKETTSSKQPNPLYSVETIEIVKPGTAAPQSGIERGTAVTRPPRQAGFNNIVRDALAAVKPSEISKVVDADGKPLVVYHGTNKDFDVFNTSAGPRSQMVGDWDGVHFTNNQGQAQQIAEALARREGGTPRVVAAYLHATNPAPFSAYRTKAQAQAAGHDSRLTENNEGLQEWTVFRPEQIKSVDNVGTFDPDNPSMVSERRRDPYTIDMFEQTAELQRQSETPAFKRWFGSSKAVDDDGKPLVVYHATPNDFDAFKAGGDDPTKSGKAIWFGANPESPAAMHNVAGRKGDGKFRPGTRTIPAYLKIERPLLIDDVGMLEWGRSLYGSNFPELLSDKALVELKQDYDGIIYTRDYRSPPIPAEYVVFDPTQIKSAIGNSGAFDPTNPNILAEPQVDFKAQLATRQERRAELERRLAVGMEKDGIVLARDRERPSYRIALTADASNPGSLRVTSFDGDEPTGHREYKSISDAATEFVPFRMQLEQPRRDNYTLDLFSQPVVAPTKAQTVAKLQEPAPQQPVRGSNFAAVIEPIKTGEVRSGVDAVTSAANAAHVLASLRKSPQERFFILALDAEKKPIAVMRLTHGGATSAMVPAEVVAKAVYQTPGVAHIWYAHNHPSGATEASAADIILTRQLTRLFGEGTGIAVDGHVIIAGTRYGVLGPDGERVSQDNRIPAESRRFTIPITERTVRKSGALLQGDAITSPAAAKNLIPRALKNKSGVAFLDARGRVVATLEMSIEEMGNLRSGPGSNAGVFFSAAGRSNAVSTIIHVPEPDTSVIQKAILNLSGAAKLADINVLDALVGGKSYADAGEIINVPRDFMARTALDVADHASAMKTTIGIEVTELLDRMLGGSPDLEVRLFEQRDRQGFAGRYRATPTKDLIEIATNARMPMSVAAHEGFHRIELKHLNAGERAVLDRGLAKGSALYKQVLSYAESYDAQNGTSLAGEIASKPIEAHAYAFQFWREGNLEAQGALAKVFQKIAELLERIRNLIAGYGFKSTEDLFDAVDRGVFASSDRKSFVVDATEAYASLDDMQSAAMVGSPSGAGPAWFSQLARSVDNVKMNSASGVQWKATIKSMPGVKADEIEWTGINEWLDGQRGKVTKDQINEFLRGNGVQVEETVLGSAAEDAAALSGETEWQGSENDTQFGEYQLPGGTNYRELILTLPANQSVTAKASRLREIGDEMDRPDVSSERYAALHAERVSLADAYTDERESTGFQSGHFDQPNILAHVRFNERTDADGKRVLFLEEIQSDLGQQGKRSGFRMSQKREDELRTKIAAMEAKGATATEADKAEWTAAMNELQPETINEKLPRAPFVGKTEAWVALVMKRMIRHAAENGFDRVAWTNGNQQIDRYKNVIRQRVDRISWGQLKGQKDPQIYGFKDKNMVFGAGVRNGRFIDGPAAGKTVEAMLGKDIAAKIHAKPDGELTGEDLSIGGEGMKAFYDNIVPNVANDVLKKLGGGKVGTVNVALTQSTTSKGMSRIVQDDDGTYAIEVRKFDENNVSYWDVAAFGLSKEDAESRRLFGGQVPSMRQPSIDITPQLAERAMQGMPLFSRAALGDDDNFLYSKDALNDPAVKAAEREMQVESLKDLVRKAEAKEITYDQLMAAVADHIGDAPPATKRQLLGAHAEGIVGGIKRTYISHFSSGNNIAKFSKGFENTFKAVSTYGQFKNRLIATNLEVGLSKWLPSWIPGKGGGVSEADIKTASLALMTRTSKEMIEGSPEYNQLVGGLTKDQRDLFDQGTKMMSDMLRAEFEAEKITYAKAFQNNPAEYATWEANRGKQVDDLIRKGYVPERRYGDHAAHIYLPVTDENGRTKKITLFYDLHEDEGNAKSQVALMRNALKDVPGLKVDYDFRYKPQFDASLSFTQFLDMADSHDIKLTQPEKERIAKSLISADSLRRLRIFQRKNIPGYSVDATRVLAEFAVNVSNKIAYAKFGDVVKDALSGMEIKTSLDGDEVIIERKPGTDMWALDGERAGYFRGVAERTVDFAMGPQEQNPWSRRARMAAGLQFLGGSAATAVVQLSSLPLNVIPNLYKHTGYGNAVLKTWGAFTQTLGQQSRLRSLVEMEDSLKPGGKPIEGFDRDLVQALIRAGKDGTTLDTELYQLMGMTRGGMSTKSRVVQKAVEAWMFPFRWSEQVNRISTFIASYKVGKEKGLAGDELYTFSQQLVHDTQFRYDEANRPGVTRNPIWSVLFTFKSYPIYMSEMIVALHREKPQAAVAMLVGLSLAAGVNGLPFAEDLIDIIDTISQRIFGKPWNMRRAMRNYVKAGSEAMVGVDLSGVFMHGLANELFGLNIASRVGLGNLLPGTRLLAMDSDAASQVKEVFGPVGSMFIGWGKAAGSTLKASGAALSGDFGRAGGSLVEAARVGGPAMMQNAVKGVEQIVHGYAQDSRGRKIVDVGVWEGLAQAFGFSSADLGHAYDLDRLDKQTTAFYNVMRADMIKEIVGAIRNGDKEKIDDAFKVLNAWNKAHPDMMIQPDLGSLRRSIIQAQLPISQRTLQMLPKHLRSSSIAMETVTE